MNLSPTEAHQQEMRHAHYDGAPGILVSGLVWIAATLVGYQIGTHQAVWTLLIGGALIHPLSLVVTKALGRPAATNKTNALNQLAMASTIWLILCCAMSYGLYLLKPEFFFPAMMATIGCRYMIFASMYGRSVFWVMGVSLVVAGNAVFFMTLTPTLAAAIGGVIEIVFAAYVFSKASANTSAP
jgi:hypothetical protein